MRTAAPLRKYRTIEVVSWRVYFGWKLRCRSDRCNCRFQRFTGFERPKNAPVDCMDASLDALRALQWFERLENSPVDCMDASLEPLRALQWFERLKNSPVDCMDASIDALRALQ